MDGLWATESEGIWLIVRAISFQDIYNPIPTYVGYHKLTIHQRHVIDGQTTAEQTNNMQWQDRAVRAFCTIVHRAVKTNRRLEF